MRVEMGNTFTLTVDGWEGVEVKVRGASQFKDYRLFRRLNDISLDDDASLDDLDAGLKDFGDRFLVEWNIDTDGEPLPADGDSLVKLPSTFQIGLLRAWVAKVGGGIGAPLENGSPNGSTSKVASAETARK